VEDSDKVVASIASEHKDLGHFVSAAGGTFNALGKRSAELESTVREAPATLRSARTALTSLENAAKPLGPAARGLGRTAPQLTATLRSLPGFARSVRPTLSTIRSVSPTLDRLGRVGAPILSRVVPLADQLAKFSDGFAPVTKNLDEGAFADTLGVLEGWARATQGRDAGSHIFRFGLTISADTYSSLLAMLKVPTKEQAAKKLTQTADKPKLPLKLPDLGGGSKPVEKLLPKVTQGVKNVVDGVLTTLGVKAAAPPANDDKSAKSLIDYLLGN